MRSLAALATSISQADILPTQDEAPYACFDPLAHTISTPEHCSL